MDANINAEHSGSRTSRTHQGSVFASCQSVQRYSQNELKQHIASAEVLIINVMKIMKRIFNWTVHDASV